MPPTKMNHPPMADIFLEQLASAAAAKTKPLITITNPIAVTALLPLQNPIRL
jgi:hypothetical protein